MESIKQKVDLAEEEALNEFQEKVSQKWNIIETLMTKFQSK